MNVIAMDPSVRHHIEALADLELDPDVITRLIRQEQQARAEDQARAELLVRAS